MDNTKTVADYEVLLRSHDLGATPLQVAIVRIMKEKANHVTVDFLYEHLKKDFPSIALESVDLTLEEIETAGLIRKYRIDNREVFDIKVELHDHAYCRSCGKIVELPRLEFNMLPGRLAEWVITGKTRVWYGTCPDCISKE